METAREAGRALKTARREEKLKAEGGKGGRGESRAQDTICEGWKQHYGAGGQQQHMGMTWDDILQGS